MFTKGNSVTAKHFNTSSDLNTEKNLQELFVKQMESMKSENSYIVAKTKRFVHCFIKLLKLEIGHREEDEYLIRIFQANIFGLKFTWRWSTNYYVGCECGKCFYGQSQIKKRG